MGVVANKNGYYILKQAIRKVNISTHGKARRGD